MSTDNFDRDLDDADDARTLEEGADQNQPYGEVTSQDIGTQDAIDDGGDLATELDDADRAEGRADGVVPLDEELVFDDLTSSETIEDRIAQEEPDPTSDIVPPDAGRRY